jgi:Heavy metal binding domain
MEVHVMLFTMRIMIVVAGIAVLAGCAAITTDESLPADHPANPRASEAPLPVHSQTLTLDSSVPAPATDDAAMGMQHEGMQHGMAGMTHDTHGTHNTAHEMQPQTPAATRPGENAAPFAPRVTPATVPTTAATVFTCPMHKEVVTSQPGNCPKCGMKLVPKPTSRPADHGGHGGHP